MARHFPTGFMKGSHRPCRRMEISAPGIWDVQCVQFPAQVAFFINTDTHSEHPRSTATWCLATAPHTSTHPAPTPLMTPSEDSPGISILHPFHMCLAAEGMEGPCRQGLRALRCITDITHTALSARISHTFSLLHQTEASSCTQGPRLQSPESFVNNVT